MLYKAVCACCAVVNEIDPGSKFNLPSMAALRLELKSPRDRKTHARTRSAQFGCSSRTKQRVRIRRDREDAFATCRVRVFTFGEFMIRPRRLERESCWAANGR